MLPGHRRIRRAEEFRSVMRGPARAATATVVVHVGTLADPARDSSPRAGFVVGRGVGPAVTRNRVKRRLRHSVLPLLDDLPDGWGVVVRALPASADAEFAALDADVRSALRRSLSRVGHDAGTPRGVSL